ncbi:MAG: hypothetical protein JST89_00915 [Cyanobacteria bacterium SZAS-4]|nr:hypothetical protein [Cyanobacteria bacterium SZAS-4]
MFRSFCVGAIAGFLFGSSKQGKDVREGLDGFLTELTSGDAIKALDDKRNELSELATNTFSKFTGSEEKKSDAAQEEKFAGSKSASAEKSDEQNFEPEEPLEAGMGKPLDADKAQELADKLGAKPSTPEDENLAAFHHDDELKSA